MLNIKLIAFDLDDTLFRSDLTISAKTRAVFKKAASLGIVPVLASGRVPDGLLDTVKALGLNKMHGYLICGNGTVIIDSSSGDIIDEATLPTNTALEAFNLIDAEGFSVQIYGENCIIVSRKSEFSDADHKLTGLRQFIPKDFRAALVEKRTHKMVIPADPTLLKPLEEILRNVMGDSITLFTSKPYFLEIMPPSCDKGTALARVAGRLGFSRDEVLAAGDSMNDEAMIRWAGHGLCMKNGNDRVKKIARYITEKTNDEDGLADFIERYVLGNETPAQNL
jgi:Cof subfamily protein (haloacid dehalogenase superfamily)